MTIKSIYFLGIGALGAKYASNLYNYNPSLVKVIVNNKRKERYQANGIFVNDKQYNFDYITAQEKIEYPDFIFIAVKSNQLSKAIEDLKPFVGENTLIISLMNGISSERILADTFGWKRVIKALAYMDAVKKDNKITYASIGKIIFGETTSFNTDKLEALHLLLNDANIPNQFTNEIDKAQWAKYLLNVVVNQLTFLLNFNYGQFRTNSYLNNLVDLVGNEVVKIANLHGVAIGNEEIEKIKTTMCAIDKDGKTSMLQDREAKRLSEVNEFSEEIIRLGKQYNVPTPYNTLLFNMIKAIEEAY